MILDHENNPFDDFQEESGLSGSHAWAKLDRTVRQLDEEKVKDCKDDMDTLLVFVSPYMHRFFLFLN